MALQKTTSGKVDKRTKEYKEMLENLKKARKAKKKKEKEAAAKEKTAKSKTSTTKTTASKSTGKKTTSLRRADGHLDMRTKEGKAAAERMAKARKAKGSLKNKLKKLFG